ncbi:MAG: thymidine phosphorylase, partial [Actinobacteria bacterium]|nr:thymidine phosphorylase [Actinomycetota bacterium]
VIRTKRDGGELSDAMIEWFITNFTDQTIADEQASALLMAILFRGLSPRELATWTAAMIASGERLDLSAVGRPTVDKHSTGGVGDKVSLPLCPIVAACGVAVPQLSGRGLGHTGGTLDKMESIPGWSPHMSNDRFIEILREVGAVIAAAGDNLAPADRRMYALRDVTGTVEAVPLISSSIMSKKIAEGTDALVLDVKVGSGAFLPSIEMARELATTMVGLGKSHGVRTSALLTDMDQPLGLAVGNALEVSESIEMLQGGGPADLIEVTVALARRMCELAGSDIDPVDVLASGAAMDRWNAMIRAQGGDPTAPLPVSENIETVSATGDGHVARIDARKVGEAAWRLGAGRSRKEDPVSPIAGIVLRATAGQPIRAGEPLFDLHVDDPTRVAAALDALDGAVTYSDEPVAARRLIHERID